MDGSGLVAGMLRATVSLSLAIVVRVLDCTCVNVVFGLLGFGIFVVFMSVVVLDFYLSRLWFWPVGLVRRFYSLWDYYRVSIIIHITCLTV